MHKSCLDIIGQEIKNRPNLGKDNYRVYPRYNFT